MILLKSADDGELKAHKRETTERREHVRLANVAARVYPTTTEQGIGRGFYFSAVKNIESVIAWVPKSLKGTVWFHGTISYLATHTYTTHKQPHF